MVALKGSVVTELTAMIYTTLMLKEHPSDVTLKLNNLFKERR